MAPSLRKSAPSTSTSTRTASVPKTSSGSRTQLQQGQLKSVLNNTGFARVSKARAGRAGLKVKFSDVEKGAFERWGGCEKTESSLIQNVVLKREDERQTKECQIEVAEILLPEDLDDSLSVRNGSKRKRGDGNGSESEDRKDTCHVEENREQSKKVRKTGSKSKVAAIDFAFHRQVQTQIQLLSPPASRDGTDCDKSSLLQAPLVFRSGKIQVNAALLSPLELPQALLDLISLHAAFLKALSLHYAHNGACSPAEINALMDSITRLWKKQNVQRDAVQRMLGLYELAADPNMIQMKQVEQKHCPFQIMTSGLGSNVRSNLEYVGQALFSEGILQEKYSRMVHSCFETHPAVRSSAELPLLTIILGTQTSIYRAKAASTRAEILSLSASAQSRSTPDFSKLSITESSDHTPAAVKSRTLSLFDRVRAKGLASANNAAPTSEQIMRQHAMGRISEIVEFLRMKQQQKLSTQFQSSVHDSPGKVRSTGKVSFSLGGIVRDIRQSVGVPIGEDEVKVCLRIIGQELPGDWCRIIELGSVTSITLQGHGMSGVQVKRLLQENATKI